MKVADVSMRCLPISVAEDPAAAVLRVVGYSVEVLDSSGLQRLG